MRRTFHVIRGNFRGEIKDIVEQKTTIQEKKSLLTHEEFLAACRRVAKEGENPTFTSEVTLNRALSGALVVS